MGLFWVSERAQRQQVTISKSHITLKWRWWFTYLWHYLMDTHLAWISTLKALVCSVPGHVGLAFHSVECSASTATWACWGQSSQLHRTPLGSSHCSCWRGSLTQRYHVQNHPGSTQQHRWHHSKRIEDSCNYYRWGHLSWRLQPATQTKAPLPLTQCAPKWWLKRLTAGHMLRILLCYFYCTRVWLSVSSKIHHKMYLTKL